MNIKYLKLLIVTIFAIFVTTNIYSEDETFLKSNHAHDIILTKNVLKNTEREEFFLSFYIQKESGRIITVSRDRSVSDYKKEKPALFRISIWDKKGLNRKIIKSYYADDIDSLEGVTGVAFSSTNKFGWITLPYISNSQEILLTKKLLETSDIKLEQEILIEQSKFRLSFYEKKVHRGSDLTIYDMDTKQFVNHHFDIEFKEIYFINDYNLIGVGNNLRMTQNGSNQIYCINLGETPITNLLYKPQVPFSHIRIVDGTGNEQNVNFFERNIEKYIIVNNIPYANYDLIDENGLPYKVPSYKDWKLMEINLQSKETKHNCDIPTFKSEDCYVYVPCLISENFLLIFKKYESKSESKVSILDLYKNVISETIEVNGLDDYDIVSFDSSSRLIYLSVYDGSAENRESKKLVKVLF